MDREIIATGAAPRAIGSYSQAVAVGSMVFLSGQIGLDPATMEMEVGIDAQLERVIGNLQTVAQASGTSLANAVRVGVFLIDLADFARVNEAMARYFPEPYPARAAVQVAALPRGALVEMDAILIRPA